MAAMDLFEMAPTFEDPLGMLRACHRRIERALDALQLLVEGEQQEGLGEGARESLRQILHYFATGVPRHAKDEEESLFPRMRSALEERDSAASAKLNTLEHDHAAADRAHRELELLGERLLSSGRFEHEAERARFATLAETLRHLYREHIRLEDDEILPLAASVVDAEEKEAIGAEMASRRGIDWDRQREVVARLESRPWSRRSRRESSSLL
jgi:hemerythrin-like domain-containing protein